MSATATSTDVRLPVTRFGGLIAGAMIAIAVAALIGIAVYTFVVRDNGATAAFDATAAQRIHVVREYGSAATYDATPALGQHVVRENGSGTAPAAGAAAFDHVLRENNSD
jgi:hypothetical protein